MSKNIILLLDNPFAFYALRSNCEFKNIINEANKIEVYIKNDLIKSIDFETKIEILNSSISTEIKNKITFKEGFIKEINKDNVYYIENTFINLFKGSNINYFCINSINEFLNANVLNIGTLKILSSKRLSFCKSIKSYLKEHRYNHSVSVANTAYEIAKQNEFEEEFCVKCFIAGLFHDISKDLSNSLQYEYGKLYSPNNIDKIEDFAYHQFASCYLSIEIFNLNDKEILNAISNHCTGNAYMDPMSMILYSADKVEPLREFKTENLRKSCNLNFKVGFIEVLQDQVNYFINNNIPYKGNPFTKEMYKTYLNK